MRDRVKQSIQEVIVPSWVSKPSEHVGHAKAGTLKADHWRTLFMLHIPMALLSLWKQGSPVVANDATQMASVLDTSMALTCASTVMMKKTLSLADREAFRQYHRRHMLGLRNNFPGWVLPSHHLAFHIFEGMERFSTVRNASCFASERLIGKLRRIPTNHRTGKILPRVKSPQPVFSSIAFRGVRRHAVTFLLQRSLFSPMAPAAKLSHSLEGVPQGLG